MTYEEITQKEIELYKRKNDEYTRGGDPFGNFKRVAAILSLYPALDLSYPRVVGMIYLLKQLDAVLWMLSEEYEGETENIDSRLADICVYAKLVRLMESEE